MDACLQPAPALLPADAAVLKAMVIQLLGELRDARRRLERQEHHMHLLLKPIYGSTSEKFDPRQGLLFDAQAAAEETAPSKPQQPPARPAVSKNRDRHGRGRIPEEIERKEEIHDLSQAKLIALGGAENPVELPPETSEQLDWRPSTLFVTLHVRKKYARKKLPEAIPGCLAGPGLLAQVLVSKGTDHMPLHRLEGIVERQGMRISRQTMDGWWLATAEFLHPLYTLAVLVAEAF